MQVDLQSQNHELNPIIPHGKIILQHKKDSTIQTPTGAMTICMVQVQGCSNQMYAITLTEQLHGTGQHVDTGSHHPNIIEHESLLLSTTIRNTNIIC